MNRFDGILGNGIDFDMSKICSCCKKISECEKKCARYYSCDNVAMANDVLKEYEEREHYDIKRISKRTEN